MSYFHTQVIVTKYIGLTESILIEILSPALNVLLLENVVVYVVLVAVIDVDWTAVAVVFSFLWNPISVEPGAALHPSVDIITFSNSPLCGAINFLCDIAVPSEVELIGIYTLSRPV